MTKTFTFPKASIVVATLNNAPTLKKVIEGLLALDYPTDFEVIVVNDGCTDNTSEMVKEFTCRQNFSYLELPRKGVCQARNAGIRKAKYDIIINMDHDCIPEKDWLKQLVKGFDDEKIGLVSAYATYGGTSTGFRRKALEKVGGGYDEDYGYYREDSDLAFKIMEADFGLKMVEADYFHDHVLVKPKGLMGLLKHAWQRINYHQNDVLLYKKHPSNPKVKEFLNIKFNFIVNPFSDFKAATGLWHQGGKFGLKSPRGITFLENKTPLHALAIFGSGIAYALALKLVRFYASLKFRKLLI